VAGRGVVIGFSVTAQRIIRALDYSCREPDVMGRFVFESTALWSSSPERREQPLSKHTMLEQPAPWRVVLESQNEVVLAHYAEIELGSRRPPDRGDRVDESRADS
jgi:hypothetical protein